MKYTIKRSRRKTIGLEIVGESVLVRVPYWTTDRQIRRVLRERQDWIEKQLAKAQAKTRAAQEAGPLTPSQVQALAREAKRVIPERVAYYAPLIGVTYGRITIRKQRSRWGSCSSKGNLNFNCLLMLTPPEVLDSVVVHELCHRKHMDHSPAFYREVLRVFPEYRKWDKWLRQNGSVLMMRARLGEENDG